MKFKIGRELGRGGFGIVQLVESDDGINYAQKTLNPAAFSVKDRSMLTKRFEREVRYQAQVCHPNVVSIVKHNLDDDPPWFLMPLAIGSLADDIEADRTLGGNPQKPLLDILAGLEAVHEKGFYHRDLKPANVLKFESDDDNVIYRISDFGLTTPGVGQTTTLTGSNMGGGTVLYRAPECANNFRRATAQADIYSFGAILHDIFGGGIGRVPHSELTVAGPVGPIVEKCTRSNAHRRYRSVASLREELFDVLTNENVEFFSQEEEAIINILKSTDDLTDEQWDRIFNLIDENADKDIPNYNIMRAISREQICSLYEIAPDMFQALGEIYGEFAKSHSFNFDYCDIISDKAQIFYSYGDLQLKAQITLAMLELGTGHNRWRVEHQFMRMAGLEIDDTLAERIKIEMQVQNTQFKQLMSDIEGSIGVNRDNLHPILREYLDKLE